MLSEEELEQMVPNMGQDASLIISMAALIAQEVDSAAGLVERYSSVNAESARGAFQYLLEHPDDEFMQLQFESHMITLFLLECIALHINVESMAGSAIPLSTLN